jgi:hypothetical protein
VIDVGVVNPLCAAHLRAAQREPAGAAKAYEAVKRSHYAPEMGLVADEVELVPLVFETCGVRPAANRTVGNLRRQRRRRGANRCGPAAADEPWLPMVAAKSKRACRRRGRRRRG